MGIEVIGVIPACIYVNKFDYIYYIILHNSNTYGWHI
jgi:hypothetical protein